jgi:hypothetical protein
MSFDVNLLVAAIGSRYFRPLPGSLFVSSVFSRCSVVMLLLFYYFAGYVLSAFCWLFAIAGLLLACCRSRIARQSRLHSDGVDCFNNIK